jgi:glycosyltransferase involved in cell wall biosynthesis
MIDDPVNSPLISVVMPLYNGVHDVLRAVHSVLHQLVSDFELIVVNDGSTDGGERIARDLNDRRIRVVDQENKGVSAARNRGIAEAQSELVAFLDADDEWKPDFLETVIRLRGAFPECSVFATHYMYKELDGSVRSPILQRVPPGEWEGVLRNYFEVASHSDPPLWSSAIAVKKPALRSIGGFPEGIAIGEDLLTWASLAIDHQIAFSKRQCAVFRLRGPLTGFPTRTPELPDRVGKELARLMAHAHPEQQDDFRHYEGMWHRMRASMFVQLDRSDDALEDIRQMWRFSKADPRTVMYFLLAKTPRIVRKVVLQIFTFIKTLRRRILKR